MPLHRILLPLALGVALSGGLAAGDAVGDISERFVTADALKKFLLMGSATLDPTKTASADSSGSLKLAANATATLELRGTDGSGRVEFKIFDDASKPADPKTYGVGGFWGVAQTDGRYLVPGVFYAKFLAGDESYSLANFNKSVKETPYQGIRYLKLPRSTVWRTWVFDFNPTKGATISCDGNLIEAKRWDWNSSKQIGFKSLVFSGDTTDANGCLWIDDIKVSLGGPMEVAPKTPGAPPAK